jgi:hypothetical protein
MYIDCCIFDLRCIYDVCLLIIDYDEMYIDHVYYVFHSMLMLFDL